MLIRAERTSDRSRVYSINESAFESPAEADLVDILREQAQPLIALVAEDNGELVGHIIFSPVTMAAYPDFKLMGLAPMAVTPEHQRKGIGSQLVRAGLEQCRQQGSIAVVVLGHPEFYPRFGFSRASRFGIDSVYDVPEEAFMVMELKAGAFRGKTGTVKYHAAFSSL